MSLPVCLRCCEGTGEVLTNDLEHRVSSGRFALDLNGQDAEQQDLDGGSGRIPEPARSLSAYSAKLCDSGRRCPAIVKLQQVWV